MKITCLSAGFLVIIGSIILAWIDEDVLTAVKFMSVNQLILYFGFILEEKKDD